MCNGKNFVIEFLSELERKVKYQHELSNMRRRQMVIAPQQHHEFYNGTVCPKCKSPYTKNNYKVRDNYITGQYRSSHCHKCNSQLALKRTILPVVFNSFKNYDAHLMYGTDKIKLWQLSFIPQSTEKSASDRKTDIEC